jgi:uroporphyrin-III C-methyltransferase/precorrin-2 dehydrogenase/sirohydrochlorin ferrochelatase
MDFLPLFLRIQDRDCVVIGGGEVAARKVALLRRAGGRVRVVAPTLGPTLARLAAEGAVAHTPRAFQPGDTRGAVLLIAGTDDAAANRQVAAEADANGIPVNVVDSPEYGTFIVPSVIDRSPVLVAVSSGGASPVLARLIRTRLESVIPAAYGRLADLAARYRDRVKAAFAHPADRRRFWDRVLQGPVAERVFSGHLHEADVLMTRELAAAQPSIGMGEVYLVGGGPGDPDLLTFRALRLMQQAEVVVYDRLVAKAVLDMTRRDAQRIYVGKERDNHAMRQEEINELLARLAKEGKRVVRLKGGDPFIFGRGGEEIDTLAAQGVPFQVVPGITAASGCAAYAQPSQTVVFYMGLHGLGVICERLMAHGVAPDMPAALVQQGTTPMQRVYTGTVGTLPAIVAQERPKPPTLLIVGEVVRLQEKFAWYRVMPDADQGATTAVEPGTALAPERAE